MMIHMKRGIMKKIAVMLLISMMIASATACRGGDNVSSSGGSSMAVGSETSASGEDVYSSGEVVSVDSSGNIVSADGTRPTRAPIKHPAKETVRRLQPSARQPEQRYFRLNHMEQKETARPTTDRQLPPPSMPPNRIPALKKWCNLKQTLPIV